MTFLLVMKDAHDHNAAPWVADAVDEFTLEDHSDVDKFWQDLVTEHKGNEPGILWRIVSIEISQSQLEKLFEIPCIGRFALKLEKGNNK